MIIFRHSLSIRPMIDSIHSWYLSFTNRTNISPLHSWNFFLPFNLIPDEIDWQEYFFVMSKVYCPLNVIYYPYFNDFFHYFFAKWSVVTDIRRDYILLDSRNLQDDTLVSMFVWTSIVSVVVRTPFSHPLREKRRSLLLRVHLKSNRVNFDSYCHLKSRYLFLRSWK